MTPTTSPRKMRDETLYVVGKETDDGVAVIYGSLAPSGYHAMELAEQALDMPDALIPDL